MRVAAIVLGVVVPAVTALTSSFSNTNQRITYVAVWMVWLVAMIGFLVYMEYRRDRLERQAALLEMGDDEIKAMLHGHMGRRRQGRARSRLALAEISADAPVWKCRRCCGGGAQSKPAQQRRRKRSAGA